MPILTRVDHARRLVITKASGTLHDQEMSRYLQTFLSRPQVDGYDELADITAVDEIPMPSTARARELASLSASDRSASKGGTERPTRLAIVAPDAIAPAIETMYRTLREMKPRHMKEVAVFRTTAEALVFLGLEGTIEI